MLPNLCPLKQKMVYYVFPLQINGKNLITEAHGISVLLLLQTIDSTQAFAWSKLLMYVLSSFFSCSLILTFYLNSICP